MRRFIVAPRVAALALALAGALVFALALGPYPLVLADVVHAVGRLAGIDGGAVTPGEIAQLTDVQPRKRDPRVIANDVLEMRRAIAEERGEDDVWDLKNAAGGIVDIEFIAQYLQLIHAADKPGILSVNTVQVLDNAARLGVLAPSVLAAAGAIERLRGS